MNVSNRNTDVNTLTWPATIRIASGIVACVLLVLSGGQALTPHIASLCSVWGLNGLAFYFCLELVADQRARKLRQTSRSTTEKRLTRRLHAESKVAAYHEAEAGHQATEIESAVDSSADLSAYLGQTGQPCLSA